MAAWSELVSAGSGAANSSQSERCSHVLAAMGIQGATATVAIRFSWCHLTELPDLRAMTAVLDEVCAR